MSHIDSLIQKIQLDGAPRIRLAELATIHRGQPITRKNVVPGVVPVVAGGRSAAYFHSQSNRTPPLITVAGSGAYAGHIAWWDQPVWVSDAFSITPRTDLITPRFLFHTLQSKQAFVYSLKTGGGVPHVRPKDVEPMQIPVPSLSIQHMITDILDQFTGLQVSLESELESRQQQYSHYRDILITSHYPSQESVKLGEVAHIKRGASPRPIKKFVTHTDGVPWIKIGDTPPAGKYVTATAQYITESGATKSQRVEPGDFILSNSMSFGRPYISKITGYVHDGWLVISDYKKTFDSDFLYHALRSTSIQNDFAQRAGAGTVRNLNSKIVSETLVPAPPIDQQREIVHLLDKFDLLVNDPTSGLPAEIEARRKQYEYYRDRLLTFPEKK